jgi:hypothetical protein
MPSRSARLVRTIPLAVLASLISGASGTAHARSADQQPVAQDAQTGVERPGFFSEPPLLSKGIEYGERWLGEGGGPPKDGFYPELGGMITGAGWISAGPGYRRHFLNRQALVDVSAAISWRAYKFVQTRVELPYLLRNRVAVGSQVRWQDLTQVNYFGLGAASLESTRGEYRMKNTNLVGYVVARPGRNLSFDARIGWLGRSKIDSPTGPFDRGYPDARQLFPLDPGMAEQPGFLHSEISAGVDTRDYPGYPTAGGLYRASVSTYSDRDLGRYSFRRYEAEALQMVRVAGPAWTLALHGWGVFSDTSAGNSVPFYLAPSLGGPNTLRGYDNYRFHDRHTIVVNAESRWAVFRHLDAVLLFDAGGVAARSGDLNLRKTSYGAGLRLHSRTTTLARLDIGHSREGWHVFFKTDDPFRLKRLSRLMAAIPFVP